MNYDHFRHQFEAINLYAVKRLESRGDVYGWTPLENSEEPSALLLISQDAPVDSFPTSISGIRLVLKRVPPPEVYKQ